MFNEKDMSTAIINIFDLFNEEDYEDEAKQFTINELSDALPSICAALRAEAEVPFEYKLENNIMQQFNYCGRELFGQRACLLYYAPQHDVMDVVKTRLDYELWLLEDTTIAIVRCVHSELGDEKNSFVADYRTVLTQGPEYDDLFFPPEDLLEMLECMSES